MHEGQKSLSESNPIELGLSSISESDIEGVSLSPSGEKDLLELFHGMIETAQTQFKLEISHALDVIQSSHLILMNKEEVLLEIMQIPENLSNNISAALEDLMSWAYEINSLSKDSLIDIEKGAIDLYNEAILDVEFVEKTYLGFISKIPTKKIEDLKPIERAKIVEDLARESGGKGVAGYLQTLFPEVFADQQKGNEYSDDSDNEPKSVLYTKNDNIIPSAPPVEWSINTRLKLNDNGFKPRESAVEFTRRIYHDWIGRGLTRTKLRQLDKRLVAALERDAKEHGWPEDLARGIPSFVLTDVEDVERWRTGLNADGSEATFTKREAVRLQTAAYRNVTR